MMSCLIYDSEIWMMKVKKEVKADRTKLNMVNWLCGSKERKMQSSKNSWKKCN